jgi:predicted MFS family arabinose efflux permease
VATSALVVLAAGAALAVVGGSSIAAFYVESVVAAGISPAVAGTLLAVGSVAGIAGRVGWGWVGGRWHAGHFPLLTTLAGVGAIGYLLLGHAASLGPVAVATIVVFMTGWGWPGLFNFAVIVRSATAPAVATGIVATGMYAGGIAGPFLFGLLVERGGYSLAWSFVAAMSSASAMLLFRGGRKLESHHDAKVVQADAN